MVTEAVMYKKCLVSPRPVPPANCDSSLTNPERHMHGKSPGWADVLICPLSFPSLLQIAPRGREKQQRFTDLGRGSQMCRLFVFSRCRLLVSRWRGRHSSSHVANGDLVPQSIECHHDAKGFALVTPQGQHTPCTNSSSQRRDAGGGATVSGKASLVADCFSRGISGFFFGGIHV